MNDNLHQAGVRFLRQLGQHAELVMDAYLQGSLSDEAIDAGVQERLVRQGVLYRPEPGAGLHLRRVVRALLEEALRDDRNRQIDANTGVAIAAFKTLAAHYREARHQGDYVAADAYLNDLREHLYAFSETLQHSIRVLWGRINNEFGYVASLNAKIRENELAQTQVSELLAGLELISFEELADIAGDQRELRHLLVSNLQRSVSACAQELSIVQARLLELLGRFRKVRGRSRLLRGWLLHMEQNPDFRSEAPSVHRDLPHLYNLAAALLQPAAADIHDPQQEATLLELASQIRSQQPRDSISSEVPEAAAVTLSEADSYEVEGNPLREAVAAYFCAVIDSGQPVSALAWRAEQALDWDEETWLYQVISGYEALPTEQKEHFELDPLGELHPDYNGNFIVHDVSLELA